MKTMLRWKIATGLLAGATGYLLFFRGPHSDVTSEQAEIRPGRSGAIPIELRRPLRVSEAVAGVSKSELVDHLLAAHSVRDIALVAKKLAVVGDDSTIAAALPLLADPRQGVAEVILEMFGSIASERAVDAIVTHLHDERPAVRNAAISALGATGSQVGERELIALATKPGPSRGTAIIALGRLASDGAVDSLTQIANQGDFQTLHAAINALGTANTPAADEALRSLLDSADTRVQAAALGALDSVDPEMIDRLAKLVQSGDQQLAAAALLALGKAGEGGLPALRTAAISGPAQGRWAAVNAIGQVGGPKAIAILGEILATGDRNSATAAANALASLGGPQARKLLIEAALSDRAQITGAIMQLAELEGDDVDAALVAVLKKGNSADRRAALPRLLSIGNQAAIDLALEVASRGATNERYEAIQMLAISGHERVWAPIVEVVSKSRGQARTMALDILSAVKPGDPAVEGLLTDSLFSGRRDEANYAANILGRLGSENARTALLAAITGKDKELANAAATALGQGGMNEQVKTALLAAARDNPELKVQVATQMIANGAPEGLRLADEMISSGKMANAHGVMWAIANSGTPEARQLIDRALTSGKPEIQVAAISTLTQNPDDRSTDALLRMVHDDNQTVRAAALSTLSQVGSERAQTALIEASRSGAVEDRVTAIGGLSNGDARSTQQLITLMRDRELGVAAAAITAAHSGGPEVDQALTQIVNDGDVAAELKQAAARTLRARGGELDPATEQVVTKLAGSREAYGGYGYGGRISVETAE